MKTVIVVGKNGREGLSNILDKCSDEVSMVVRIKRKSGKILWYEKKKNLQLKKLAKLPFFRNCNIIRYGNRMELETSGCNFYNIPRAVALSSDKPACRKVLKDNNIAIPNTHSPVEISGLLAKNQVNYPLVGRERYHQGGKRIDVIRSNNMLRNALKRNKNAYYSEVYPKTIEYRVHVALGKVLVIQEKPAPKDLSIVAWNKSVVGGDFKILHWELAPHSVLKIAVDACKAIGLDYGGVDIMSNPLDKSLPQDVICEINTGMAISGDIIETKYANFFNCIAKHGSKIQHFDHTEWKQPASFFWKINHFQGNLATV